MIDGDTNSPVPEKTFTNPAVTDEGNASALGQRMTSFGAIFQFHVK